jgi:hypothetical protein
LRFSSILNSFALEVELGLMSADLVELTAGFGVDEYLHIIDVLNDLL